MNVVVWAGVAVIGGVGAVCRLLLDRAVARRVARPFPFGTLAVNISGAVLLGFIETAVGSGRLGEASEDELIGLITAADRVEAAARVGNHDAIVPSISGWARQHGINTIFVDERDPFAHGFQV